MPVAKGKVTLAHPKIDPVSGEMVWFGYGVGAPLSATMSYGVTAADGTVVRRDNFEAPFACMVHDFMTTQNHVLFPILPLTGSLERVMKGGPAFAWEPDKGSYVGVMRRDADVSTIRWFNAPACYVFHPLNSWEDGDKIYCDVMRYNVAPLFPNADGSPGDKAAAKLVRWTFDLAANSDAISEEVLDDLDGEFPRVDPRVETAASTAIVAGTPPTRAAGPRRCALNAIAHLDHQTGKRQVYALTGGDATSEPVFVRPRLGRCARGRRLGDGGDLPRRRGPQRLRGLRGPGYRPWSYSGWPKMPEARALRLPRELGELLAAPGGGGLLRHRLSSPEISGTEHLGLVDGFALAALTVAVSLTANQALADPSFNDRQDFDFAQRGFVGTRAVLEDQPQADGHVVCDLTAYDLVDEARRLPHRDPSLWRQAQLLFKAELLCLIDGGWQVRGFGVVQRHLAVQDGQGWIVIDTLTTAEAAKAAIGPGHRNVGPARTVLKLSR